MSVFSKLQEYGGSWEVTDTDKLDKQELAAIKAVEVVEKEQEWGISVSMCFTLKNGRRKYIPLSRDSELEEGDAVDPKSITLLTLSKEGEDDIIRADGAVMKASKSSRRKVTEDEEDEEE